MAKLTATISVVVISLLMITVGYAVTSSIRLDGPVDLYASLASSTAINSVSYGDFNMTPPSATGNVLTLISSAGAAGNYSLGNSTAILLSDVFAGTTKISNATWTVHTFALANVTNKAYLTLNATIVDSTGTENCSLTTYDHNITTALTTTIAAYTHDITISGDYNVSDDMYLKVTWGAYKLDGTSLNVTLLMDTDGYGNYTYIHDATFSYGMSSTLSSLFLLSGISVLLAIVIYTVDSMRKKN